MPGELSLPIQEYPDYYKTATSQFPNLLLVTPQIFFFTDQDIIIDAAGVWIDVLPSAPPALKIFQVGYIPEGSDVSSNGLVVPVTSGTVTLTGIAARTMTPLVVDRTKNLVPAYSTVVWGTNIEIPLADGSGNLCWVRYRTVQT